MRIRRLGALLALLTISSATAGFRHYSTVLEEQPNVDISLHELPMQIGEWKGQDTVGLDIRSQEILKLTKYVKRAYTNSSGNTVFLYVGYWQKQTGEYQAAKHSPELCLPSNGWLIHRLGSRPLETPNDPLLVKRIVGETRGQTHLFYYWFFTGEENYSEEWKALLNISLQTFFAGRSDGGIVEISTPVSSALTSDQGTEDASKIIESFMREFYPALSKLVHAPKTLAAKN